MLPPELELRLHRFLARLWAKLKPSRDADQAARSAVRETVQFLGADAGCLAAVPPGESRVVLTSSTGSTEGWDLELLGAFFRGTHPPIPPVVLLAPLYRRERKWHVLVLRRDAGFSTEERKAFLRVARMISELVDQLDRERISEVRSRIERKIMEELRPKDLFYQILHGLRTLTGYDHSSALWVSGERGEELELVAEQIAWRKAKSEVIGLHVALDPELQRLMHGEAIYGFDRVEGTWRDWTGLRAEPLARLLEASSGSGSPEAALAEGSMLCAPLATADGGFSVLKVASRHAGTLGRYEADLVGRFLPQVAVAIHNSRRTESLQATMLRAEKKSAMADLARGVAHDVNNALGSMLPLVQQLREEAAAGTLDTRVLSADLGEIERSVQMCRRIFGGMLEFARGSARGVGRGVARRAVDGALAVLDEGMRRRGIRLTLRMDPDLPELPCPQGDLDQLLFNLLHNARDAMPNGGDLTIEAARSRAGVSIRIADTGVGIAEELLPRVQEPFFSTKAQGNGLGLAICRSIVWSMEGRMEIESRQGEGTRVRLDLPAERRRERQEPA